MIYTSYFGNWRNFPPGAKTIAITRWPPKYYQGEKELRLAPSENLLTEYKCGNVSPELFTKLFQHYLNRLDKSEFLAAWGNQDVILLCYEKPNEFCHRHIVADWIGATELR